MKNLFGYVNYEIEQTKNWTKILVFILILRIYEEMDASFTNLYGVSNNNIVFKKLIYVVIKNKIESLYHIYHPNKI
jgi:hypothetical protein